MRRMRASSAVTLAALWSELYAAPATRRRQIGTRSRSLCRRVRAPEFPAGLDWIRTLPLRLADLRGKVVLLDFWTSGCINCIHILPNLHRLHEAFPDQLQIIGVHTPKFSAEKDPDRLALAVQRLGIEHPVVSDPDYAVWQSFAVDAWPTLVFIDPQGRVVAKHPGEFDYTRVHAFIAQLLRSPLSPEGRGAGGEAKTWPTTRLKSRTPLPAKLTVDPTHTQLAIADTGNHRILIATLSGEIETSIGTGERGSTDGSFEAATFQAPQGLAFVPDGQTLVVADTGNHLLRRIDLRTHSVETIAGTGERGFPMADGPAARSPLLRPPMSSGSRALSDSPWPARIRSGPSIRAPTGSSW